MTQVNTMNQRQLCDLCEALSVTDPHNRTPENYASMCDLAFGLASRVHALQDFKDYVRKRLDDADGTYERILAVERTLAAIHAICLETGPRWTADEAVAKITQLVEASDG